MPIGLSSRSVLNNLANRLSEVGQRQEALGPAQEAVAIRRELAAKAPDAYRPDLAWSLDNLADCLSAIGQRQEALDAAEKRSERWRRTFELPAAYGPWMMTMSEQYLERCEEVGQEPDAELLAPIEEVLERMQEESEGKAP